MTDKQKLKKCPACKICKPIQDFDRYYSKIRGHYRIGNYCKPCRLEISKVRATKYYLEKREERKAYAREYRAKECNREKIKKLSAEFKKKYRDELKDCYVRDRLNVDNDIPVYISHQVPEIVESKRLHIKIKRKLKSLQNGKE